MFRTLRSTRAQAGHAAETESLIIRLMEWRKHSFDTILKTSQHKVESWKRNSWKPSLPMDGYARVVVDVFIFSYSGNRINFIDISYIGLPGET